MYSEADCPLRSAPALPACCIEICSIRWCSQPIKSMAKPPKSTRHGSKSARPTAKRPAIQAAPGTFNPLAVGQKLGNTIHPLVIGHMSVFSSLSQDNPRASLRARRLCGLGRLEGF